MEDDIFVVPRVELSRPVNLHSGRSDQPSLNASSKIIESTSTAPSGLGSVVVISGGSGYNDLVGVTPGATFVMPISDNGGSSSEIIRVLGGPSLGDLRSRLVRLIPISTDRSKDSPAPASNDALHALLSYRLPTQGRSKDIKQEWMDILEGRHRLWRGIEAERKECVRGFLVYFESEILRRAHRNFNFRGGSIGNFFLAAAQKFFRSIQSAIFLFSATTLINTIPGVGRVLPVINTNHTATIAATLQSGQVILGQCEISHPAKSSNYQYESGQGSGMETPASAIFDPFQSVSLPSKLRVGSQGDGLEPDGTEDTDANESDEDDEENGVANRLEQGREILKTELPVPQNKKNRLGNLVFSKESHDNKIDDRLPSRIERLYYVNAYGSEIQPTPNPEFISTLYSSNTLMYSCGSLWTSIVPCLALRGVATAITTSTSLKYKILLLNTTPDRETYDLDGMDFVEVLASAMAYSDGLESIALNKVVTHIIYSPQGRIAVDVDRFSALGIQSIAIELPSDRLRFKENHVRDALAKITRDI